MPKSPASNPRRLLGFAAPYAGLLALSALLTLISTGATLSLPLFARQALNRALETRSTAGIDQLALGLFGLIFLAAIASFAQYWLVGLVGNRIVRDVRSQLFAHLLRLPVAFFDKSRSGDLASYLSNDVTLLQDALASDAVRLLGAIVTLIGGVAMALFLDAKLTGLVLLTLGFGAALIASMGFYLRRLTRESLDALASAMGAMTEALSNVRLVKALARENYETGRSRDNLNQVLKFSLRAARFEAGLGTVAGVGFFGVLIGVLWFGGRRALSGEMSVGSLFAFVVTVTLISGPLGTLATLYGRMQRAIGAGERVFALLDEAPETADAPDALPFPDGAGEVGFQNVFFAYGETPVLQDLTLKIPAGQVTALVGASGAGKTTLASLLYRFYDLQSGQITIDGANVETIERDELRAHLGLVPQDPALFDATLRENIRYGKLGASGAEIEAAALAANVTEFAENLPDGFETIIGERGVTLSGGQRQRVAIARAILANPKILVLDEATSALDTRSELLVREALSRLMQGRTTLVIAHRLTTVRNAAQIAVLDAGRVAELGRHDDLLAQNGVYSALHRAGEVG